MATTPEAEPGKRSAQQSKAGGFWNLIVGAAICRKTGDQRAFGDRVRSRAGEGVDRRIRAIGIIGEYCRVGSRQPRCIGDLEADRGGGVAIPVKVIEAEIEYGASS